MLNPKSVAVIGATESLQSVGRTLMENLQSFTGDLYPVNPKWKNVLGLKAFPRIGEVPGPVDLAVIATPAIAVPDVVGECAEAGVKGAVIISAGFKECGAAGLKLEEAILTRRGRMRLIGPNCLGVMLPKQGLNATFSKRMALPGNVAFISQSGALCTSVLDWSLREKVRFSAFLSVGSMLDVGWGDLIYHLADDLDTQHPDLYGIDRRCACISFRGAGSRAQEADHRHQSRTYRSSRAGRRVSHRDAHPERRRA